MAKRYPVNGSRYNGDHWHLLNAISGTHSIERLPWIEQAKARSCILNEVSFSAGSSWLIEDKQISHVTCGIPFWDLERLQHVGEAIV